MVVIKEMGMAEGDLDILERGHGIKRFVFDMSSEMAEIHKC